MRIIEWKKRRVLYCFPLFYDTTARVGQGQILKVARRPEQEYGQYELAFTRSLRVSDHLSGGFYALPYAEIHDDPCEKQTEGQVPLDPARWPDIVGEKQDFAPEESATLQWLFKYSAHETRRSMHRAGLVFPYFKMAA